MTTRYGRNVCQDLADLSGRSVHGVDANRLRSRYARAVEERQAKEAEYENEFRLNVPHVARVQKLIAERLEAEASEVNAKLPVASVYDAFMRVKGHADRDKDAGLRALHGHLERMWKKNRTGSITAEQYLILHDHYKRNFPRSAAAAVIEQIGQEGYTTLPLSDLTRIASDIHTQEDFDRAMVYHGLNGPLPHQVKSRRFVLGLINEVDSGERYLLEGMDFGPSFCGEDGDEAGRPFEGEDSVPQQKVRTRGPKAQRNAQMLSGGIEELERVLDGVVIDEVESGAWINPSDPEAPLHVGIVWTQSGYIGGEGVVYITEGGSHPDVALQGADEIWTENLYNNQEMRQRAEEDARDELRQDRSLLEGEPSDEEVWELADQYLSEKFAGGVWTVTVGELLGLLDSSTESWAAQIRSALGEFEGDEEGAEYARSLRERGGLRKAQQTPAFDSTAVARVGGDTYLSLNDDPVYVGVVHDSSGFTPSSAVWIQQGWGSEDTALQEAFAELED